VFFILAAFLSAWISPTLGAVQDRRASNNSPAMSAENTTWQADMRMIQTRYGNVSQRQEMFSSTRVDPVIVEAIQQTITLLLADDETRIYLPFVER
jgi:hypothetical protein